MQLTLIGRRRGPGAARMVACLLLVSLMVSFHFMALPTGRRRVVQAAQQELPFPVNARAAVLLDVQTGKVLYSKNSDEQILPASLAKIMTMLLALEAVASGEVSLSDAVAIGEGPWRLSGSSMFLEVGDRVSFEDLLYGIGVLSGNDAALAVAEHLAGTEAAFTVRMNQRAQELGLHDTAFANSHGLANGGQRTTAGDMARLAQIFVRDYSEGLNYMAAKTFDYGGITQSNRNGLLFKDDRVTGLKTGFLEAAGHHLVATAADGDMSMAAAVLGADSFSQREDEALALLNYGFSHYKTMEPAWGLQGAKELTVYKGRAGSVEVRPIRRPLVTVPRAAETEPAVQDDLPEYVEAPIEEGQVVGTLTIDDGSGDKTEIPLVAQAAIDRGGLFKVLIDSIRIFVRGLWQR